MIALLLCSLAESASTPQPTLGILAVGEAISGEAIAANFNASSIGTEIFGIVPLRYHLETKVSVGYRRLGGTTAAEWLWYAPVSATIGVAMPYDSLTLLAAAGPSLVVWGATAAADPAAGSSGGNWGVVAEAGGRVATNLVRHSLHDPDQGIDGIDGTVLVGFRGSDVHNVAQKACATERECGFNFSALRISAGVDIRF